MTLEEVEEHIKNSDTIYYPLHGEKKHKYYTLHLNPLKYWITDDYLWVKWGCKLHSFKLSELTLKKED